MFDNLTGRLSQTFRNLRGVGTLTDDNMQETLREVRRALLEADVALPVAKAFIEQVTEAARGQQVLRSLDPGQALVKVVHEEMVHLLGDSHVELDFTASPPAVILIAGLQGSGKTTSAAKLARYLTERLDKKVMLTSTDVYRPAAREQLGKLAEQISVPCELELASTNINTILKAATKAAKQQQCDVMIVDTAGRLHIDTDMMDEIKGLHKTLQPTETLFVVDSMTGQDAANTAKAFHEALPLTGVILTKADGDARGGAALSVKYLTGKPIKFIGVGEKTDALEAFHPDRIASRILGMGDILSLVEDAEQKVDKQKADKLAKKLKKGRGFDLDDYRDQLFQMQKMGGMAALMDKLPGMGQMKKMVQDKVNDKSVQQTIAIINSMTIKERRHPALVNGSRKKRIAKGSGNDIPAVNRLLKQFKQMEKMLKKFRKPGAMQNMMKMMGGQGGDLF